MLFVTEMNRGREKVNSRMIFAWFPPCRFTVIQLVSVHGPLWFREWEIWPRWVRVTAVGWCEFVRSPWHQHWGNALGEGGTPNPRELYCHIRVHGPLPFTYIGVKGVQV